MKFYTGRLNFLLLALCFCTQAFPQGSFNRLYGTYATEIGKSGFIRSDSTIYAVGTSSAYTELSSQVYLVKTDKNGNLLWSRFYGGAGVDDATDMYYHTDTCIYLVSNSYQGPERGYDIHVIKTDLDGNALWEKSFGTSDWDIPAKITRISDSSFAICGYTYGNSIGLSDGMLFAFNEDGDSLWFKNMGSVDDEQLYDLALRNSDTITACGERVLPSGKKQGWVTDLCISTQVSTSTFYGSGFNYRFSAMDMMPSGSYVMGVVSDSSSATQNDLYIWKINPYTHAIAQNLPMYATGDEYCTDIFQHDGNYYMLNNTTSYGLGGYDVLIYRFDTLTGFFVGGYTFGTNLDNFGNDLFINNNGTFTVVGSSPHTFGPRDLWIVNLDTVYEVNDIPDSGFDINDVADVNTQDEVLVLYPNPTEEGFYLRTNESLEQVTVYDGTGRVIVSSQGQVSYVNTADISTGIYWVHVAFANGSRSTKMLVIK